MLIYTYDPQYDQSQNHVSNCIELLMHDGNHVPVYQHGLIYAFTPAFPWYHMNAWVIIRGKDILKQLYILVYLYV